MYFPITQHSARHILIITTNPPVFLSIYTISIFTGHKMFLVAGMIAHFMKYNCTIVVIISIIKTATPLRRAPEQLFGWGAI